MAKKKQTGMSKKQFADALRMGSLEFSEKYKVSLSTHQRLKLSILQDYEFFKAIEVPIEEISYKASSAKIKACIENLKNGQNTVFEEKAVKPRKVASSEKKVEGAKKKRGRPVGSGLKSKSNKKNTEKEVVEIVEVQEVETIEKDEDMKCTKVQKEFNIIDELKNSNMSFFVEFLENITNLDDLVNLGVENYYNKVKALYEKITAIINDLYHIVEFEDIVDIEKKAEIFDSLKATLIQRRRYKDEDSFVRENKSLFISFCTVFKKAKQFNEKKETRCYTFRQIGQDVGLTGLSKSKDPENIKIEERMIELERVRIKKEREEKRVKKEVVAIDKIERDWKRRFHEELDTYTRTELYKEASNLYNSKGFLSNFNELKEFIIEMEIMPELLYNKGYFLINKQ